MLKTNWICSQIGAREHYAVPRVLHRTGKLERLYTDFWASAPWRLLGKMTGKSALAARFHPDLATARVTGFNIQGLKTARQRYSNPYDRFLQVGEAFGRDVVKALDSRPSPLVGSPTSAFSFSPSALPPIFFSYDTGFLEPARWVKSRGGKAIVCQMDPARFEVDLVKAEEKRWTGWARHSVGVPETYFGRREAEWEVADLVMVNSEWTKTALIRQGVSDDKIVVVPLAFEATSPRSSTLMALATQQAVPPPRGCLRQSSASHHATWFDLRHDFSSGSRRSTFDARHPLRVLFLGQVILRKGIQYLIEAARLLKGEAIHFDIVGPLGISNEVVASVTANMTFHGAVSRDRTVEFYRSADLFVLPTLSDGFALTQLEAMAHGLPVIATLNCGEVVTDGLDGLIVPASDSNALAEAFQLLIQDPEMLRSMSEATKAKVDQFSLPRLGENLAALETLLFP